MTATDTLPAEARERFPDFDADDPSTWPEPDRCTDGAPFGPSAYRVYNRWESFLAQLDREQRNGRRDPGSPRCRNAAKTDHLCGTHDNVRRTRQAEEERSRAAEERRQVGTELARRVTAHGIPAENRGDAVLIHRADAELLLRVLDAAVQHVGLATAEDFVDPAQLAES